MKEGAQKRNIVKQKIINAKLKKRKKRAMDVFPLLIILLPTSIAVSGDENPTTSAQWSYLSRCVRSQNPQLKAYYDSYHDSFRSRKNVDQIKVDFDGLYTTGRCNIGNEIPDLAIRKAENNDWDQVKPAFHNRFQTFWGLNPCATYRVHIDNSRVRDQTVGPYYEDTRPGKPTIGFRNNEYEKNLTRTAITVTPKSKSASIKLPPICAKTIQLEIFPKNNIGIHKDDLVHIDPSRMDDIDFSVDELQPCTKYVVNLALSLETQNATALERDYDVYRKSRITYFWTLPNLDKLKSPILYDNSSHFLSWDQPWEFLQHECAKPILDKNSKFTLTISNRLIDVNQVKFDPN